MQGCSPAAQIVQRLWEALRHFRDQPKGWEAQATLYKLLFPWVHTWLVGRHRLELRDAEELANHIVSEVCRWLPKCKGLDNRDPERGAAETFNWVRSVRESRFQDWVRQKQRRPQLELVEELPEEPPEEPPEKHLGREARMRALEAARQGIRQIIREQAPRPYFEQARHLQVGLTLPELNKQLHTFERVRWHQEPTLDVGVSLGESGTRKQIQDRVSQWVKRGGRALMVGAQYAQTQVKDADVREVLENLAKMLAEPLKRRKT